MIEQAMEKVYEAITGKCAHDFKGIFQTVCKKCGKPRMSKHDIFTPDLATSLDAWRPIWEAMTDEQKTKNSGYLIKMKYDGDDYIYDWELTPLHHLEAALRMLGEDELAEKLRLLEKEGG